MLSKIASTLIFAIGVMSIVAGGKAIQGWDPGYTVIAWLPVYNLVMGALTLASAVPIWLNDRRATAAAIAIFSTHSFVLLLLLTVLRETAAKESIAAMAFRLAVWVTALGLMYFNFRRSGKDRRAKGAGIQT